MKSRSQPKLIGMIDLRSVGSWNGRQAIDS